MGIPSSSAAKGKGKATTTGTGEKKARPVQPRKKAGDVKKPGASSAPLTRTRQSTRLAAAAAVDPDETPAERKARLVRHVTFPNFLYAIISVKCASLLLWTDQLNCAGFFV